jgi:hypothetical protein
MKWLTVARAAASVVLLLADLLEGRQPSGVPSVGGPPADKPSGS